MNLRCLDVCLECTRDVERCTTLQPDTWELYSHCRMHPMRIIFILLSLITLSVDVQSRHSFRDVYKTACVAA
jgi:hypothetical protein